jgi:hypothetical protein
MRIEVEDIFFMSVRWTIALFLFYKLGFIYGFIICTILNYVFRYLMWKVYKLEAFNAVDELFLNDDEKNRSNIVSKYINF